MQPFSILDAQRVIARQYGFASWRRLKLFIQKSTQQSADYDPALAEQLTRRNAMRIAPMQSDNLPSDCNSSTIGPDKKLIASECINFVFCSLHRLLHVDE